jgi:hypothetical protein
MSNKVCLKCGQEKVLGAFYSDSSRKDGKEPYCKKCKQERQKAHFLANHDRILAQSREYNQRPDVRLRKQEYEKLPEVRQRRREQDKKPNRRRSKNDRRSTPEAKEKQRHRDHEKNQRPEIKKRHLGMVKQYALNHPEWTIVQRSKRRAKAKCVPFDLHPKDILIPTVCPVLGILLQNNDGEKTNQSPSIDEIIPGLGYVVGNVAVISNRANTVKNDGTADEHRAIADWMDRRRCGLEFISGRRASTEKEKRVVLSAKQRAKNKGREFDLQLEDIEFPERCPILGVLLIGGTRHEHESSPSLDRVDSSRGYTLDNVAIISHRANFVKSDGTADEHRKIADWMDSITTNQLTSQAA